MNNFSLLGRVLGGVRADSVWCPVLAFVTNDVKEIKLGGATL